MSAVGAITKAIETFMASEINIIHSSILWDCLDDDADNAIIVEHLKGYKRPTENTEEALSSSFQKASLICHSRINILRKLQHSFLHLDNTDRLPGTDSDGFISPCGISRVFRMAASLLSHLGHIAKV